MTDQPAKRHRLAFTKPKDRGVINIMKSNSTQAPFFRLPREVRDMIYGYLLGNKTIHITRDCFYDSGHFHHMICEAEMSDAEACKMWKGAAEDGDMSGEGEVHGRHQKCAKAIPSKFKRWVKLSGNRLDLSILRTCHQAYIEANPILWRTNVWSFLSRYDNKIANIFLKMRSAEQRRLMKMIHVEGADAFCGIGMGTLEKFARFDLVTLEVTSMDNVQLNRSFHGPIYYHKTIYQHGTFGKAWPRLPAKEIQVICTPFHSRLPPFYNSLAKRNEFADKVQVKLLELAGELEEKREKQKEKKKSTGNKNMK